MNTCTFTLVPVHLLTLLLNAVQVHPYMHTNTSKYSGQPLFRPELCIYTGKTGSGYTPLSACPPPLHTHRCGVRGVGWSPCIVRLGGGVRLCDRWKCFHVFAACRAWGQVKHLDQSSLHAINNRGFKKLNLRRTVSCSPSIFWPPRCIWMDDPLLVKWSVTQPGLFSSALRAVSLSIVINVSSSIETQTTFIQQFDGYRSQWQI